MHRNLKVLGLALVAALALSAVAVPSASAQTGVLTTENAEPVTLTGFQTGAAGANGLEVFGGELACPGSTYTGHKIDATPHEPIPNGSTELTITPHTRQITEEGKLNCKAFGLPATVTMNGCDLEFYDFTTIEGPHAYSFLSRIDCAHSATVVWEVYLGEAEGVKACTLTVSDTDSAHNTVNQALVGGRVTNTPASGETANDFDLTGTISGIHVERHGLCVSEDVTTSNEGKLKIDLTVKADDADGFDTGITISH